MIANFWAEGVPLFGRLLTVGVLVEFAALLNVGAPQSVGAQMVQIVEIVGTPPHSEKVPWCG